jgi:hypothetical protein
MGGDHPDYVIKGQLQTPFDPKHPNAIHEDFEIPAAFPPKITDIYAEWNVKFTAPVDDSVKLTSLLRRYSVFGWCRTAMGKVGVEACCAQPVTEEASDGEGGTQFPDAPYGLDPSGWGAGGGGGTASHLDRSGSPVPVDPYKFVQWDMNDVTTIPFGSMKFSTDQIFGTNKADHATILILTNMLDAARKLQPKLRGKQKTAYSQAEDGAREKSTSTTKRNGRAASGCSAAAVQQLAVARATASAPILHARFSWLLGPALPCYPRPGPACPGQARG